LSSFWYAIASVRTNIKWPGDLDIILLNMKHTQGLIPLSTTTIIPEREQSSLPKEKEIKSRVAVLQNYPAADPKINHFSLVELRGNEILFFCSSQSICSSTTINLKA
jgi:hypothetical protein